MIDRFEYARALDLAVNLPAGSRTVSRIEPRAAWSTSDYLMAGLLDSMNLMRYENAGGKGRKPKPVERPKARKPEMVRPKVGEERTMALLFGKRG